MADEQVIGLAEAIDLVRAELARAQFEASGQSIGFDVSSVEVEFGGELRREGRIEGQLRFWVVLGGASDTSARSTTQRIKVTLDAVDTVTGRRLRVNDRVEDLSSRPPAKR